MDKNTIEIGHKASPFAKWLFFSTVQALAISLQDTSTNHWNSKKTHELTQDDIASIRQFVQSHYESDIHALLTYGGKPAPTSYTQFATLKLGSCQMLPDSYYAEVKKLHEYYEIFWLEGTHLFKTKIESRYDGKLAYDRAVRQLGLETAGSTGAEHIVYLTHLLKDCKTVPNDSKKICLVPYYEDITQLFQTKHSSGKPIAYIIASFAAALEENKCNGIDMKYIITTFFEQYKSKGGVRLQEFLEAFYSEPESNIICLINDFKTSSNEQYPQLSKGQNREFFNYLVSIQDFKKIQTLYKQSKQDRTLKQRKDLLLDDENYSEGVAYLNSIPLDMLLDQLANNSLKQHYIAFQNV